MTKKVILKAGLEMASQVGLECVTIGTLANTIGMSKSGLFAHFRSKENLQIEILEFASQTFAESVVIPALAVEAGIARIKALVDNWIRWTGRLTGGCIFVTASTEFSDRPGKVRVCLVHQQEAWVDSLRRLARSAIRAGDFRPDMDCDQFAFDFYSLLLGFHYYDKLLNDTAIKKRQEAALERLLRQYVTPEKG